MDDVAVAKIKASISIIKETLYDEALTKRGREARIIQIMAQEIEVLENTLALTSIEVLHPVNVQRPREESERITRMLWSLDTELRKDF